MKISSNHPGGNIKVISIDDNIITIEQDLRDTDIWWFYWNFSIENANGREYTFKFNNGEVVGRFGPAVCEEGHNWRWQTEDYFIDNSSFNYKFKADEKVYFSFSMPYQLSDYDKFAAKNEGKIDNEILALSNKNRNVPMMIIGDDRAVKNILFTCRNHACESMASYLLEGLIQYIIDNIEMFSDFKIYVIPFVDIDGVENGDQGKARIPHDHNRDYDNSIYNSVKAIKRYFQNIDLDVFIDFHCPYKWGERNDHPFMVKDESPHKEEQEKLSGLLERETKKSSLKYDSLYDIEAGEQWNSGIGTLCSAGYFRSKKTKLSFTFEMPYFGLEDNIVDKESCYQFGVDFGKALYQYLNEINKTNFIYFVNFNSEKN